MLNPPTAAIPSFWLDNLEAPPLNELPNLGTLNCTLFFLFVVFLLQEVDADPDLNTKAGNV